METGGGRAVGDVEDLGHLADGEVEVVVQDHDGPLIQVEMLELVSEPITVGHIGRGVRCSGHHGFGRHVQLDQGPSPFLAGDLVAGANRQSMEPGIPGTGITQCAEVPPGQEEGILDRVLGAIPIAKDEASDAGEPVERELHQLREGIEVPVPGPYDDVSLHGCHRFGTKHVSARSYSMGHERRQPIPTRTLAIGSPEVHRSGRHRQQVPLESGTGSMLTDRSKGDQPVR